ncbi:hypothetical protein K1719_017867 [Acacia pycnantha]|nr:hypothetical protein K1719_017867 [Acacia pycnantha]
MLAGKPFPSLVVTNISTKNEEATLHVLNSIGACLELFIKSISCHDDKNLLILIGAVILTIEDLLVATTSLKASKYPLKAAKKQKIFFNNGRRGLLQSGHIDLIGGICMDATNVLMRLMGQLPMIQ